MSTFGAGDPHDVDTYVVNFNVMTKDNSPLPLHANVVNKITGPIQRGQADLEFLVSISPEKMADTVPKTSEPVNIDLLIGSDYFWNILETESDTTFMFISSVIKDWLYSYRKVFRSRLYGLSPKCFDLFCDDTS